MRSSTVLARSATLLLVTGAALAQSPADSWQCIPAPPGAVTQRGKVAIVPDATAQFRVFSSATRRWATWPFPSVTVTGGFRVSNDAALFEAPPTYVAFSSHRGSFERLDVGPNAFVVNPSSNRNDSAWAVVDGNDLHVFSGFAGGWSTRTFPAGFHVIVQRDVIVVSAGNQVWGYSATLDQWATTTTSGPIGQIAADGAVGVAENATDLYGFSAMQGSWSHQPRVPGSGTANAVVAKNVAMWSGNSMAIGFSGVRGAFAVEPTGTPGALSVGDHWGMLEGPGTQRWMFSDVHARWTAYATATLPQVVSDTAVVALLEANRVHAWSAVQDAWVSQSANPGTVQTAAAVLDIQDSAGGSSLLYSGLTGRFVTAPAGTAANLTQLARNAILLWPSAGNSTAYVFASRSGQLVPRPVSATATAAVDPNSSLVGIVDGSTVAWFDPRREVWSTATTSTTAIQPQVWRTAAVTYAGNEAVAFSVLHGRTETKTFAGPPNQLIVSSEIALASDGTTLCAFSATPELLTPAQFPEFRRMAAARGAPLPIRVFGPAAGPGSTTNGTSIAVVSLSLPAALPSPFGLIEVDPRFAIALPMVQLDPTGFGEQTLLIPDDPAIAGVDLATQALFAAPDGTLSISRMASFRLE